MGGEGKRRENELTNPLSQIPGYATAASYHWAKNYCMLYTVRAFYVAVSQSSASPSSVPTSTSYAVSIYGSLNINIKISPMVDVIRPIICFTYRYFDKQYIVRCSNEHPACIHCSLPNALITEQ